MNYGFRFYIWRSLYHDGTFIHNIERIQTVRAKNEQEARKQVILEPEETSYLPLLVVFTGNEYIYSVQNLGRAKKAFTWEYEK